MKAKKTPWLSTMALAIRVARATGVPQVDCYDVIQAAFKEVAATVASGREVRLSGFGHFYRRLVKTTGLNFRPTGGSHWVPKFRAADALRKAVRAAPLPTTEAPSK